MKNIAEMEVGLMTKFAEMEAVLMKSIWLRWKRD